MIPQKKKNPDEIAALRGELGIPDSSSEQKKLEEPVHNPPGDSQHATISTQAAPESDQANHPTTNVPQTNRRSAKRHSLRKKDLPLAPSNIATTKTALPDRRHRPEDIAEIKRRDAIANLTDRPMDPATHLKKITAHPALLIPAYLCAFGAGVTAWQHFHYFTPLALIAISSLMATFIFFAKKRSRHHSAILIIIIIMTLAFGGLQYAPLFVYAP